MAEFAIAGYESFQKNRMDKKGGGVISYAKSTLSAIKIEKQDAQNHDSVYVELTTGNKKVTVATVYRPPKQQPADAAALYEEMQTTIRNKNAVVNGDFNCLNINWNLMHGDQEGNRLVEMVEDSFLSQLVTQPRRRNNILDLVLTTDTDLVSECKLGESLSVCDHHMIRLRIRTNHHLAENKSKVPDYRYANFDSAREMIPPETWAKSICTSLNHEWNTFRDKLIEVERMTVPMKCRRVNSVTNPPWMTEEIRRAINLEKKKKSQLDERDCNLRKQRTLSTQPQGLPNSY